MQRPSLPAATMLALAFATLAGAASRIDEARELQRQGKLEAAHELLSRAAGEYRASGDGRDLALALGVSADISIALGHYEAAIQEVGEALKLHQKAHTTASIGDDYNTAGMAYQYMGNYPAALDQYQKALGADREYHDAEGEVTRLNNIGNIYNFQGRYSDALRSYDDAMEKIRATSGEAWNATQRQLTLANLAVLFQRLGQEQRALDYYRQIAEPRRPDSDQRMTPSERAQVMLNQGVLYRRLGDPVKALELYRAAQALFAADRHPDGEIGALRNIGIVLTMDLNDPKGALESFTRALVLANQSANQRGIVQARLYRGGLLRQQNRKEEAEADLQAALRGAQKAHLVEEQWKALAALGGIAEDRADTTAAERDYREATAIIESVRAGLRLVALRSDFLADKRDVYDSLIGLRLRDPHVTPAEVLNLMERSRARTLLDRLRGRVALSDPQLGAIQSQLAPRTVLVEYWTGSDSAAAVWVTNTNSGLVRFDAAALRAPAMATATYPPGNRLLEGIPLADRLIVVPDGVLSAVPFESLRIPGSSALLIEKCEVSYLPSARFVARKSRRKWLAPWATEIVELADPPVDSDPFGESWPPLPASVDEARAIARILPGRARIHLDTDMQKRYLTGIGRGAPPLMHLATHALIDTENPDRSRILLAHDYLLQEEVYDLDLTGVDLVTLSACDTARGKFVRGESTQAFSQAFLAAGATATVTTLWRVQDRATSDFMQQFYYGLARGESKDAALRSAKLRFLRSGSALAEPRYWAAFVLDGDGSSPVPRAIPWSACLIAGIAIVAVAATAAICSRLTREM